ncbi:hypothetical protein PVAG01_10010 [Phlyctema vagabunda]|uniref:Uncharacterized protein n=1 Tax=Phlyctema vagabunda TaxID=108571 RepID=A0ABR4P4Q8_9HELO
MRYQSIKRCRAATKSKPSSNAQAFLVDALLQFLLPSVLPSPFYRLFVSSFLQVTAGTMSNNDQGPVSPTSINYVQQLPNTTTTWVAGQSQQPRVDDVSTSPTGQSESSSVSASAQDLGMMGSPGGARGRGRGPRRQQQAVPPPRFSFPANAQPAPHPAVLQPGSQAAPQPDPQPSPQPEPQQPGAAADHADEMRRRAADLVRLAQSAEADTEQLGVLVMDIKDDTTQVIARLTEVGLSTNHVRDGIMHLGQVSGETRDATRDITLISRQIRDALTNFAHFMQAEPAESAARSFFYVSPRRRRYLFQAFCLLLCVLLAFSFIRAVFNYLIDAMAGLLGRRSQRDLEWAVYINSIPRSLRDFLVRKQNEYYTYD